MEYAVLKPSRVAKATPFTPVSIPVRSNETCCTVLNDAHSVIKGLLQTSLGYLPSYPLPYLVCVSL